MATHLSTGCIDFVCCLLQVLGVTCNEGSAISCVQLDVRLSQRTTVRYSQLASTCKDMTTTHTEIFSASSKPEILNILHSGGNSRRCRSSSRPVSNSRNDKDGAACCCTGHFFVLNAAESGKKEVVFNCSIYPAGSYISQGLLNDDNIPTYNAIVSVSNIGLE